MRPDVDGLPLLLTRLADAVEKSGTAMLGSFLDNVVSHTVTAAAAGGFQVEGIFRLSAGKKELNTLREQVTVRHACDAAAVVCPPISV